MALVVHNSIRSEIDYMIKISWDWILIQGHLWKIPFFVVSQGELDFELNKAVTSGDAYTTLKFLKMGANIHQDRYRDFSLLHDVILRGYWNLIDILVQYGADIESESVFLDYRPIHMLSFLTHNIRRCFEKLLKHKVNLNSVDFMDNTFLHMMMKKCPNDIELIKRILQFDVNINAVNDFEENILHKLAVSEQTGTWMKDLFNILFDAGLNIDFVNRRNITKGHTPLHIACIKKNKELVTLLLRHGASLNSVDKSGLSVLDHLEDPSRQDVLFICLTYIALRINRGEKIDDTVMQKIESNHTWKTRLSHVDIHLQQLRSMYLSPFHSPISVHNLLCKSVYAVANYLRNPELRYGINQLPYHEFFWIEEIDYRLMLARRIMEKQKRAYRQVDLIIKDRLPYVCKLKISEYLAS